MRYCKTCNKLLIKNPKEAYWQFDGRIFCGQKCRTYIGMGNHFKGLTPWNKGKKGLQVAWNKGKKWNDFMSPDGRKKALANLSRSGENHWNWQGGITAENHKIRDSKEYKEWRIKVFQRDRFRCVLCGYRSIKPRDIRADHIRPFSLYPELRLDIKNGRTLCVPCDIKHGWQLFREKNPRKQVGVK